MTEDLLEKPLQIRRVPAGNAWAWIVSGFELFKANPAMWIIILVIYLAMIIPISLIPVIGSIVSPLLAPVFVAGMMWGCKALVQKKDLEINHLFEGFKKNTAQLVAVGGIYMLSLLLIAVLLVLNLDRATIDLLVKGQVLSTEQASAMMPPILIAMFFTLPIFMAYWYAPVLTGLHNLTAVDAMKLSLKACLKNIAPFLLYGFIVILLFIPLVIIITLTPVSLHLPLIGLVTLALAPIMITSLYASYADVFNITETEVTVI